MVQICVNKSAYLGVTYDSVSFLRQALQQPFQVPLLCLFWILLVILIYEFKALCPSGEKAFVQQYQKLYRLLMKASMVFRYLQASKRRWLALHQILWSLLLQRLVVVIPKAPFTFYIKSFAFGRFEFQ